MIFEPNYKAKKKFKLVLYENKVRRVEKNVLKQKLQFFCQYEG